MERTRVMIAVTQSNFGGAQRYVYDLATGLPRDRFDVVVAAGGNGPLFAKLENAQIRTIHIDALKRHVSLWNDIRACRALYRLLKKERPHIVHTNSSKMGALGAIAARAAGIPIVFTAHGWEFNAPRPILKRTIIRALSVLTVLLSDQTIAVSRALVNQMPYMAQRKMTVIPNGIPPVTYLGREEARQSLVPDHRLDEMWIGTIAELHPVKNLPRARGAFARLARTHPRVRYVIIGEGCQRERLEALIHESHMEGRAHLIGFLANAWKYDKAFDIFLLPSLSEAFSYAVLEAGYAGRAVIASDVGGIPEVINSPDQGILVPAQSEDAFFTALERLATNQTQRDWMGANLSRRVSGAFSYERMVTETIHVYETLRNSASSRA